MFGLILTLLAAPSPADLATANPDAPALEFGWRDGLRAKGGGRIRILGDGEDATTGFFDFHGFIELHNEPGSTIVVPYQLWRGRFSFEGGYRRRLDGATPWTLKASLLLEHESDHSTSGTDFFNTAPGFVNLNALAAQGAVRRGGSAPTHAALTLRAHVLTCTFDAVRCGFGGGLRGEPTFEAELSLAQELQLSAKWNAFAAVWGQVLVPTRDIVRGRRLAFRLGAIRHRATDALGLFFQLLAGTDLGYFRQRDTLQVGVGVAWVPD